MITFETKINYNSTKKINGFQNIWMAKMANKLLYLGKIDYDK